MLANERKPKPLEDVMKAAMLHKSWLRAMPAMAMESILCSLCPYKSDKYCMRQMLNDVTFYLETILENAEEGRK